MKVFRTQCVGMQHRLTMSGRNMMKSHIEREGPIDLVLIREHDNAHDHNAIMVKVRTGPYKGMHIGYLPRTVASVYAPAIDEMHVRIHKTTMVDISPEDGTAELRVKVIPKVFKKSRKGT